MKLRVAHWMVVLLVSGCSDDNSADNENGDDTGDGGDAATGDDSGDDSSGHDQGGSEDVSSQDDAAADTAGDDGGEIQLSMACTSASFNDESGTFNHPIRFNLAATLTDHFALTMTREEAHVYGPGDPLATPPETATYEATGTWTASDVDLSWEVGSLSAPAPNADAFSEGALDLDDREDSVPVVCWTSDYVPAYRYDTTSGECRDFDGREGLNALPIALIHATHDGQCADLADVEVNEEDLGYPLLNDWDLRGADLSNAQLHFADIIDAQLEGANLATFVYGYANITGAVDDYTVLPETGDCTVEDGVLTCRQ
jgi:hypothetical protein